jgi:DNA sulfur modification protein DndB
MFNYSFPAVKGVQANSVYYISMVPCKLLKKLFLVDNNEVLPEYRAQRKLNYNRIPEIRDYILNNRDTYVFSALAASIDGDFSFHELNNSLGVLEVDMDAVFLINDGQHRNAAIQAALEEDKTLGEETIPIVFFADKGLKRSQQMFTDLNKYAVKPSKSQNTFYDHKDLLAQLSREIIEENQFLKNYTDVENDNLGKFSAKLFTLNSFYSANKIIIGSLDIDDNIREFCKNYWNMLVDNINEWKQLENKELAKKSLREEYIITQNVVLYAFGKLGNFFLKNNINFDEYLVELNKINWLRTNPDWLGRTIINGKISTNTQNVNLTYIKIKELIGLKLTDSEKKLNEIR